MDQKNFISMSNIYTKHDFEKYKNLITLDCPSLIGPVAPRPMRQGSVKDEQLKLGQLEMSNFFHNGWHVCKGVNPT